MLVLTGAFDNISVVVRHRSFSFSPPTPCAAGCRQ
jgi:hypothetical protein